MRRKKMKMRMSKEQMPLPNLHWRRARIQKRFRRLKSKLNQRRKSRLIQMRKKTKRRRHQNQKTRKIVKMKTTRMKMKTKMMIMIPPTKTWHTTRRRRAIIRSITTIMIRRRKRAKMLMLMKITNWQKKKVIKSCKTPSKKHSTWLSRRKMARSMEKRLSWPKMKLTLIIKCWMESVDSN